MKIAEKQIETQDFLSPPKGQSKNIVLIVGPLIMGHLSILVSLGYRYPGSIN